MPFIFLFTHHIYNLSLFKYLLVFFIFHENNLQCRGTTLIHLFFPRVFSIHFELFDFSRNIRKVRTHLTTRLSLKPFFIFFGWTLLFLQTADFSIWATFFFSWAPFFHCNVFLIKSKQIWICLIFHWNETFSLKFSSTRAP